MRREYHAWHSPAVGHRMELLEYGHTGEPLIAFPTSCGRFHEWEDFGLVGAVRHKLEEGRLHLFCIDSIDGESWYDSWRLAGDRVARDGDYDRYLVHELVPFVASRNQRPLTLAGASFGGYHAIDKGLRHPDVFKKLLSMSGAYDMSSFLDGHSDEATYLRQPFQYLPRLEDTWFLEHLRGQTIILAVGEHDFLLGQNQGLSQLLHAKGIPNVLDVWGGYDHDWPAWKGMMQKHVGW
jgi:esterase/lipase superfamily enzyme